MKLLILGGTSFLGRHVVEKSLASGHEVTIFHRGLTNPNLFPQVEELLGDRTVDLGPLRGRRWDAVVDTSGYTPQVVRASVEQLSGMVEHYTFISTISVYEFPIPGEADETAQVQPFSTGPNGKVTPETYGTLKAACEAVVTEAMPGRSLIVRPGLLVGPFDPTDRFTYWVRRIARGGEIVAPGLPGRQIQFIDARDAAQWILRMAGKRSNGVFNSTGPGHLLSMGQFLETVRATINGDAHFTWIPESFLTEAGIAPWSELPLWLPEAQNGMLEFNIQKALGSGLEFHSMEETIRDTLSWDQTRVPGVMKAGLTEEREKEILQRWHSKN